MTNDYFFDTDCLSAFLWINDTNILEVLYGGKIILPDQVYLELSKQSSMIPVLPLKNVEVVPELPPKNIKNVPCLHLKNVKNIPRLPLKNVKTSV